MLSCIQKTEQPAKGPLSWGLWSAARDGAEREGTSFPIPMLCFPTFSLTPVQRQKMKSCVPPPPINQSFLGQSSVSSYAGAEEEEGGAGRESGRRGIHLSPWQLTGRAARTHCDTASLDVGCKEVWLQVQKSHSPEEHRTFLPLARLLLKNGV